MLSGYKTYTVSLSFNDQSFDLKSKMLENPTLTIEIPTDEPHCSNSWTDPQIVQVENIIDEPPCCIYVIAIKLPHFYLQVLSLENPI